MKRDTILEDNFSINGLPHSKLTVHFELILAKWHVQVSVEI